MEDGACVDVLARNDGLDDLVHDLLAQLLRRHVVRVLQRDDHGVNAYRDTRALLHAILTRHLARTHRDDHGVNAYRDTRSLLHAILTRHLAHTHVPVIDDMYRRHTSY